LAFAPVSFVAIGPRRGRTHEVSMSSVRTLTLADAAWPRAGAVHNSLLVVFASLMTAAAAQIALPVPWSPVPITGQTFAVLLSGAVLGPRRAFAAQVLYLIEGASGLSFFAGGVAGAAVLAGPTAGYLAAFPFAAALTGWLCARGWDRRFITMLAAMLIGSSVIFALGLAGLSRFLPPGQLLAAGLLPFLPGDLVKAAAAALTFPQVWKRLGERGGSGA
jgi:biotin transport system substrate-specific component